MRARAHLPAALVLFGCAKAAAVLWIAPRMGAPMWVVSLAAALWVLGPSGAAAWIVQARRARAAGAPSPAVRS